MPLTKYAVRVIPPAGESVVVDILDPSGTSVGIAYSTIRGGDQVALPRTITGQTDFYLPTAGAYDVSVKLNDVEIAAAGGMQRVTLAGGNPVRVEPVLNEDERVSLAAASGGLTQLATPETAGFALRINTEGDAIEAAAPGALLTSSGVPLIRCQIAVDSTTYANEHVPFYGRLTDAVDDYIGFKHAQAVVITATAGQSLLVASRQVGSTITDLTQDEIDTLGAAGGLSTEGTQVFVTRLDTPGFVRLVQAAEVHLPGSPEYLLFDSKSGETGTSGVTLTDGAATLAAGTYSIAVIHSIDVFWG